MTHKQHYWSALRSPKKPAVVLGRVDTIFVRLQSTTGSIYHPVGFDSRKQSCLSVRRAPSPGTLQDAVSRHPPHLGSHCHTLLSCSSGLAMPMSCPVSPQTVYTQEPAAAVTTHTTEPRVPFIWQGGLQLQQPPPMSRRPDKFPVHNTGLLPGSWEKNRVAHCILHVKSV